MKKPIQLLLIVLLSVNIYSFCQCPKEGKSRNGSAPKLDVQKLNILKNRDRQPTDADIDNNITLDDILTSKDDITRFSEEKAATIEGYVFKATDEKGESCNCFSINPEELDVHIYIANKKHPKSIADCAIIEITKYTKQLHPDWNAEYINLHFKGRKVNVTGWLLYDFEHKNKSFESNPEAPQLNRYTVWELHPITDIKVAY